MISKIISNNKERFTDEIIVGLIFGLTAGLTAGLIVGLINITQIIPNNLWWILGLILIVIILSELLFNKEGYKKGSKFWFTAKRKGESLLESLIIVVNLLNIRWLIVKYDIFRKIPYEEVLKWMGYIGVGIIGLALLGGIFYLWVKLNERRVKK